MDFLKADMKHLFDDKGVDKSKYADKVDFRDPITKYGSINGGTSIFHHAALHLTPPPALNE